MGLSVTWESSSPAVVPLARIKEHVRPSDDADDAYLVKLGLAALRFCEAYTDRAIASSDVVWTVDRFPCAFVLPKGAVQSVDAVKYINDSDGVLTTLAADQYRVTGVGEPTRITPAYNVSWPTARFVTEAVRVEWTAGYATADDVPEDLKLGMLLLIGHWYENREEVTEANVKQIPVGAERLMSHFRLGRDVAFAGYA